MAVGEELRGISISVAKEYLYIDYVSVNYGLSATDSVYQDKALKKEILAQENGSDAQLQLIEKYRNWSATLSEEERASQVHQDSVAAINEIIRTYFSKTAETVENKATVVGNCNVADYRNLSDAGHLNYQTGAYVRGNLTQINSGDITFTLPVRDYNAQGELYFGIYAVVAENNGSTGYGTIQINGESYTFDSSQSNVYLKATVKDGKLTVVGDSADNAGEEIMTVTLSDNILNGTEGLVISYTGTAWSQVEVTEMKKPIIVAEVS